MVRIGGSNTLRIKHPPDKTPSAIHAFTFSYVRAAPTCCVHSRPNHRLMYENANPNPRLKYQTLTLAWPQAIRAKRGARDSVCYLI